MPTQLEHRSLPKKPGRRTRRILGPWARLGLLTVAIAIAGLAAVGLVVKAVRPYREASIQTEQLAETRRQIAAYDAKNDTLRRQIDNLKTPAGIATEARKIGYLRPGEIPIVVENTAGDSLDSPADTFVSPESPAPAASGLGRTVSRFWNHLMGR